MHKIFIYSFILIIILFNTGVKAFKPEAEIDEDAKYNYNYADVSERCPPYDPYETINRKVFIINSALDAFFLRPVAKIYDRLTNNYMKERVETFVDNIAVPLTFTNYALQAKSEGAFKSFWRFTINSTFGIAGLFDVASKVGLTPEPQDFGNTLARYGVGAGPYIVLPIYGGMGARDITNPLFTNNALNPAKYVMHRDFKTAVTISGIVHYRAKLLPFTDYISQNSTDPYVAVRDAILQQREDKMAYPTDFKCPSVK